jgi:chromosome segregation ATPase
MPECPGECNAKVAVLEAQMSEVQNQYHEISEKLDKILEQTTRHNGRLTRVESDLGRNFTKDEARDEKLGRLEKYVFVGVVVAAFASGILQKLITGWMG